MKTRSVIAHWLLALLLLLSQQLAAVHAISHIGGARSHTTQEKQLPADQACAQCLAFASIGSALTGHASAFIGNGVDDGVDVAVPPDRATPEAFRAFQSRAPPAIA